MAVKTSFTLALSLLAACGPQTTAVPPAATPVTKVTVWSDTKSEPSAKQEPAATVADDSEPSGAEPAKPEPEPERASGEGEQASTVQYLAPETNEHASQSPINIVTSRAVPGRHKIKFHYQSSKEHVDNLGHTVKVTYDAGSSLDYDGKTYDLVQFHFHTPSEHLLDGVTYPMEMHLVHSEHSRPEHLLVVGVLFKEGDPNSLLDALIADVPTQPGEHADRDAKLDASSVFKRGEGYYHYEGSLTTPPYSESVTWLVLDQVHDASAEQIEALNRIEGNNARHIQAQRARLIDHTQ
jgi:carbonic anhydrase